MSSQVAVRRPWNRTTARSFEVDATTGGIDDLKPCGPSTITSGTCSSSRKRSVRSAFFSLNQVPLRNSTATLSPNGSSAAFASRIASRFSEEVKNHFGYWRKTAPSWPVLGERGEAVGEGAPDLGEQLAGQVLGVQARLVGEGRRQGLADRLGEALRLRGLAGEQRVGLDVEHEVGRRALHPQLGQPARRQRVVGRVDLHDREARRVELEPLLGGAGIGRVEHARGGHRGVGPGRRPDTDQVAAGGSQRLGRGLVDGLRLEPRPRDVGPRVVGRAEVLCRAVVGRRGHLLGEA